jgi:uridine phosphorylase
MPQIHLRAEPGDYAPLVLLPGDPGRATMIAGLFDGGLDNARLVNQHRSLLGYTGTFNGVPVSVQTSGMGTPSFSIVMEELLMLGVKRFIRTGASAADSRRATWSSPRPRCRPTARRGPTCTAIRLRRPRTST